MMLIKPDNTHKRATGGYTVIELLTAVGLFIVVALIASSAFLGVVGSNRKTIAIRTAMDNLNAAVENMSRNMKTGTKYHCGSTGVLTEPQDCSSGSGYITFKGQDDTVTSPKQFVYRLGPVGSSCDTGQICVSTDGGANFFALTAPPPELSIEGLAFRVYGSVAAESPAKQPRVVITILGSSGVGAAKSTFDVQTTISQRAPDFP